MTNSPSNSTTPEPSVTFIPELLTARGHFDFPMTNDYMFRAVLQDSNKALTGLISSLLHIPPGQISSVEITNPIVLGDDCGDKEFRLDINVILNNCSLINLEMQVACQVDWPERSLVYLCRNFDMLSRGQEYAELKPVVHIGILDFRFLAKLPEFYSKNMLINTRTHEIYSDKLSLHMLNLKYINLATEEDKAWGIDRWAALFKATTWEDIKMIAQNNEYLTAASNSIFRMNADDMARKRCLDREEHYRDIRTWKKQIAEMEVTIAEQAALIDNLRAQLDYSLH